MIKMLSYSKLIRKMSANIIKLFKKKMKLKRNLMWRKRNVNCMDLSLNKF